MAEQSESIKPEIPAWRLELNEKLRAIKAKKELDSQEGSLTTPGPTSPQPTPAQSTTAFKPTTNSKSDLPKPKIVNPVVEKALRRARRANENAIRASIPRIESARQSQTATALALDKEATARKLEQDPLPEEKVFIKPETEIAPPVIELTLSTTVPTSHSEPLPEETFKAIPVAEQTITYIEDDFDCLGGRPDPLDYIYAEVGKSEGGSKSRTARRARRPSPEPQRTTAYDEIPTLLTHSQIALVDFFTIALSSAPFLALIRFMGGNFSQIGTILVGLGLIGLVTGFYLILTQSLCGKTFGMMVSGTHVADAQTDACPGIRSLTIRTLGYYVSFIAALAGFLWVAVDAQHRGWHDLLSHTIIVRDK